MHLLFFALLMVLAAHSGFGQANHTLTTATCPVCTASQVAAWRNVTADTQDVSGADPVNASIGRFPSGSWIRPSIGIPSFVLGFRPFSSRKQTLCGVLDRFQVYDPWGDEHDWNLFIRPGNAFRHILEMPRAAMSSPGEAQDCPKGSNSNNCMEAEITPDEGLYNNPFFPNASPSPRVGKEICVYGPWVTDAGHSHRPEIHPADLIWWRDSPPGPERSYFMMALQDDSNRFNRPDQYNFGRETPPASWQPWSKNPKRAEFSLAFEVDPAGSEHFEFFVSQIDNMSKNVNTAGDEAARRDADDGMEHGLEYNGKVLVRAYEWQPASQDDDIGVRFDGICRRADGRLQGYVVLSTRYGNGVNGGEGYHTLFALRRQRSGLGPQVSGGLQSVLGTVVRRAEPLRLAPPPGNPGAGRGRIVANSLRVERKGPGGRIVGVVRRDDQTRTENLPLALTPRVTESAPDSAADASPDGWTAWAAAAGLGQARVTPLPLRRAAKWRVDVASRYSPLRDGVPQPEEESDATTQLNSALDSGDRVALERFFGAGTQIGQEWTAEGFDLTAGRPMAVRVGQPSGPGEIGVERRTVGAGRESLVVTFPAQPGARLYRCVLKGRIFDSLGHSANIEWPVWNHFVTGESRQALERSLRRLFAAGSGAVRETMETVVGEVSADQRVSLDEFTRVRLVNDAASRR